MKGVQKSDTLSVGLMQVSPVLNVVMHCQAGSDAKLRTRPRSIGSSYIVYVWFAAVS